MTITSPKCRCVELKCTYMRTCRAGLSTSRDPLPMKRVASWPMVNGRRELLCNQGTERKEGGGEERRGGKGSGRGMSPSMSED